MIADLLTAYRQIREIRAKEKAYKRMIGKAPDYTLIRELINQSRHDVVATITFLDGTKLDLRRADATDRLIQLMHPDKAASW